jgi:hypothetical protein
MMDTTHGERREHVVSCYIEGFDTLEKTDLRCTEGAPRSPYDNSPHTVCSTWDCVCVFDAGCWRRTSHRMTMTCCAL